MKVLGNNLCFKVLKYLSIVIFIMYLSYLTYLTFFDHLYGRELMHRSINIIPLKTIIQFLTSHYNQNIIVTNIAGNVVAFIPMGFLLPIVFYRLNKFIKVLFAVLIATISIEILQYITGVGATDIDDVILNVLGGILGYLIYKVIMGILVYLSGVKNASPNYRRNND